jgi:class 3 adenylate cyclase
MLLEAFAALRGVAGGNVHSAADAAATSSVPNVSPEDRAERRQVTVMFSDLVGSTALSARMDPEDMREVISAYQNSVAESVGRFGGFVAKYMGDGVLIYFGYPHAHEDDAERAVRAGLQLVAAIGDLRTHAALQTRVGIATGLVVVGDLIGSGASQEQAIVGDTPTLPKTRCCCSRSSTRSGQQTMWHSMATSFAISQRSFWRSPRSRGPQARS